MSNFPNNFDDDTTLPFVNDNITEAGGEAINALRDAVLAIQMYLGLGGAGTTNSISARFGVSIAPDGTINPSAITSLGLVTLPITNGQIANNAGIPESKLRLDHRTQDLFNYIRDLAGDVNQSIGWISTTGIKLEPHLMGAIYRHDMSQIDVSADINQFLFNNRRTLRDNLNSYTLVKDMNAEVLAHQWADGSPFGSPYNITTNNGSLYSSIYGHTGSGIFINTSRFNNIPQTADDVQLFAEYLDSASIFLLGTRIQNLYTSGISRVSRSSNLTEDGYGQFIIPPTPAVAFLKNIGNSSSPYDDIDTGDDIIEFKPSASDQLNNTFDAKFALVKIGDIIRINYGTLEVPFVIKEKKYSGTIGSKRYIVRIAGKNQFYTTTAIARVDKPLANSNKYGELSISPVNNSFAGTPSLIINNPRGAQTLGIGFNPDQFDEKHYLLYIAFYPTGSAQDGYTILPGIDVTGNQGTTPGLYTLESIVQTTNNAFRKVGFNYRLTAFSYQGEFGICLADSYNNSGFSIISAAIKDNGTLDVPATSIAFPANVVDLQPVSGTLAPDPLGFGPTGNGIASPPYYTTYGSSAAALNPTKLLIPLRRNSYYVDGTEKERLNREPSQALDGYGDGYWVGTITDVQIPSGRVQTTYRIPLDLSTSGLKAGKTIVVQSLGEGTFVDFGRFIIQSVVFGCSPTTFTDITVYDAVHAAGTSPVPVSSIDTQVAIYFGPDSVSFNTESATDYTVVTPFKRHFEVYVDKNGDTFTHERARINITGATQTVNDVSLFGFIQLNRMDIVRVSPKLRGFQFGTVNKITMRMFNYDANTGVYDGYLSEYDGTYFTHHGPRTTGRKGEVTRFYDETNTDYIEIVFDPNASISSFTDQLIDFQLFPTLRLDDEIMLLGTCQVNDTNKVVSKIVDGRQFGNTSEKDLSTSVFDYMSIPEKHLHTNGIIRGFDIYDKYNGTSAIIYLTGGVALVDGKILNINNDTVTIPAVKEQYGSAFYDVTWMLCVNSLGDYKIVPMLDVISNPLDITRYFMAVDVVSSSTYNMVGHTFEDLVNNKTDLIPLYIVTATVTGTTSPVVAITTEDARRYIYKKDWGTRPNLTTGTANGEFRNFEVLKNWLNYNSSYENEVNLKGNFTGLPTSFAYRTKVRFFGDGNSSMAITATTAFTDVDLSSMIVTTPASGATVDLIRSDWTDVTLSGKSLISFTESIVSNCNFTMTRDGGGASIVSFTDSVIDNCVFNLQGAFFQFFNCKITNCQFNTQTNTNTISVNQNPQKRSIFEKNTLQLVSASTSMPMMGTIRDNAFHVFTSNNVVTLNDNVSVTGNLFYAANGTTIANFIDVVDGTNGVISGNHFYRNTNVLTSGYITAPSPYTAGQVTITDNFFDSTTINGTDQNLVLGLPAPWMYRGNLNTPFTARTKKLNGGTTYTVGIDDEIILIDLVTAITIILPSIVLSPPGRVITIKDVNGRAHNFPITIQRNGTDLIEGVSADFVYTNPYGSVTLVATTFNVALVGEIPNWSIT